MIDSHCHLADKQFKNDLDVVIRRAVDVGVEKMIAIADSIPEAEECLKIAETYENVFCTVGVHPHAAHEWSIPTTFAKATVVKNSKFQIQKIAKNNQVVAIGEIGLDYHYMNSPKDVQQKVFKEQLEIAKELGMPAVIHNRESIEDLTRIINEVDPPSFVIHCCTEKWEDVSQFVGQGHLLSFTGIATYPKSDVIRNTIKQCPLEQMMIETDAPYLAPIPHRGKRNEPAFVVEIAKCIAEVKGVSVEEVDAVTTKNAEDFYSLH